MPRSVTLKTLIPSGLPGPEHFEIVESPTPDAELPEGALLLRVLVFSADPYLRGGFKTGTVPRVVEGFVAGRVEESRREGWVKGDLFGANLPFTTLQVHSPPLLFIPYIIMHIICLILSY